MKPVPMSRMRKRMRMVAIGWVSLFSIVFWLRARDLLKWAAEIPFPALLVIQFLNSAISSLIIVELLRAVITQWEQWNDRQHLRAVFYTSLIVFAVSSAMLTYGRLSMQRVVP